MIHVTLQGKGGVGKTLVASLIAQQRRRAGVPVVCVDADPINASLAGFAGLEAKQLELLDDAGEVAPGAFDTLVEIIMAQPAGSDLVLDTGATTFVPLSRYLVLHRLPEILAELGHDTMLHVVVPGGPALGDSLVGLQAILREIEGARIVVWLNEYFGPLVGRDGKEVELEKMAVYRDNADRIESIIELREEPALFAADYTQMLSRKQLFDEVVEDESYSFMSRQRLRILGERLLDQVARVLLVPPAGLAAPEAANGADGQARND